MLKQCWRAVWIRQNCGMAERFVSHIFTFHKCPANIKFLQVYIKDVSPKKMAPSSPPLLKSISNTSTTTTKTTAMPMQIGKTTLIQTSGSQTTKNSDFLSSIIQAVGIQVSLPEIFLRLMLNLMLFSLFETECGWHRHRATSPSNNNNSTAATNSTIHNHLGRADAENEPIAL